MEFISIATFHHPDIPLKLKIRRGISVRLTQQLKVTSFAYVSEQEMLYIGLSDGQIYAWKRKNQDQKVVSNSVLGISKGQ